MQATEIERSPGSPSLMVTTRRRFTPQGTSCSFLQAVTQALHSMQRSASQRNFILAIGQLLPMPVRFDTGYTWFPAFGSPSHIHMSGLAFMPMHFAGVMQGEDRRHKYPPGADPYVVGEAANTALTYGYDIVTHMQETKCSLCRIEPA